MRSIAAAMVDCTRVIGQDCGEGCYDGFYGIAGRHMVSLRSLSQWRRGIIETFIETFTALLSSSLPGDGVPLKALSIDLVTPDPTLPHLGAPSDLREKPVQ